MPADEEPRGDYKPTIGLALSGGGSRAIAFHLGCLRALNDRGILSKTRVISSISGGSVIAALYAYGDEPFEEFDARAVALLRNGLVRRIAREALFSSALPKSLLTIATAGTAALLADLARLLLLAPRLVGLNHSFPTDRLHAPLRRYSSRTVAFEMALAKELFASRKIHEVARPGLDIVINATELRTGTAFRFGSQSSGSWRFRDVINNDVTVAKAVAASAAYPAMFPALDEHLDIGKPNSHRKERVILTDGGVYDNLGVTCLEPGRAPNISTNVFPVDYIICCDAGHGEPTGKIKPYWWHTRMKQSFETTHRRVQTSAYARLHKYVETGELAGFVFPYLGQQDHRLPFAPPDLVPREEVMTYPTDFSPMADEDIHRLSLRGDQLTRLLIARYTPEL